MMPAGSNGDIVIEYAGDKRFNSGYTLSGAAPPLITHPSSLTMSQVYHEPASEETRDISGQTGLGKGWVHVADEERFNGCFFGAVRVPRGIIPIHLNLGMTRSSKDFRRARKIT